MWTLWYAVSQMQYYALADGHGKTKKLFSSRHIAESQNLRSSSIGRQQAFLTILAAAAAAAFGLEFKVYQAG